MRFGPPGESLWLGTSRAGVRTSAVLGIHRLRSRGNQVNLLFIQWWCKRSRWYIEQPSTDGSLHGLRLTIWVEVVGEHQQTWTFRHPRRNNHKALQSCSLAENPSSNRNEWPRGCLSTSFSGHRPNVQQPLFGQTGCRNSSDERYSPGKPG